MATLATQVVQIRPVRMEDLSSIHHLEEMCFRDPFPSYFINQLADANPSTFLVAEEAGKIIGYGVVDNWTDHPHLVSIAVRPDSRRKGVAQALLDQLTKRLLGSILRLELRKSNNSALALYLKNGFTETGTAHSYYTDGEDAIQMEKLIPKSLEIPA
jgi:[ribosomal protein S18]-alanine N-acetyltransferase